MKRPEFETQVQTALDAALPLLEQVGRLVNNDSRVLAATLSTLWAGVVAQLNEPPGQTFEEMLETFLELLGGLTQEARAQARALQGGTDRVSSIH